MPTPKRGDLRLLRNGVVFGPVDRQGLERLLSSGRVSAEDHVSVNDSEWVRVADYLSAQSATVAAESRPPEPRPVVDRTPRRRGDLSVIRAGRIIGSLTQDDVEDLRKGKRLDDDDLVCALGGPWMRLGDFLAPSPAPLFPTPPPPNPPSGSPAVAAEIPIPSTVPAGGTVHPVEQPSGPVLKDEWFVRVRGIHSAPLKKHHVRSLYQAREVTLENMARHATWLENDWRPIGGIEELRDVSRL